MKTDWSSIDALRSKISGPSPTVNQHEDDQVKLISYNMNDRKVFPVPLPQVELLHLTDLQVGSKNFIRKRFIEYRDWILSEPYRFALLGGDLVDAATVLSIASPYENTKEPLYQVREVVELLQPLADAGRILASVGGNHERRTKKSYGDCGVDIAARLKIPYSCGVQLINIYFAKHSPFTLSLWHGKGNPRTKGAIAQMLDRFMSQSDSQLFLVGHVHNPLVLPGWRQRRVGGKIKFEKVMGAVSSSFMSYWNSYGEEAAMHPSETMMARVILERSGKWELTLR
jgi:hypothetical protein